jgi:succinoglycan biosynthesis protein ExoU
MGIAGSAGRCVDVLMAARNRADTIERAIFSALSQDEVRAVIVVDDGSTDETAARARQCDRSGERVVIRRLASNLGPAAARNVAIELSTASWLAVLDADDYFFRNRLGILLSHAQDCDFIADELVHVSERNIDDKPPQAAPCDRVLHALPLSFEQFIVANITRPGVHRKELGFIKPLMRRTFLDRHRLRYDERLHFASDYALYARALAAGARFLLFPWAGYVLVEREGSVSTRHNRQGLEALQASDRELMALTHLSASERQAVADHYADLDRRAQWLFVVESLQRHDYGRFLSIFFRSPDLTKYLTRRLITEVPLQIKKRLSRYGIG